MLSSSAFAEIINTTAFNTDLLIGLSAGPTWVSGNQTQTINLQPDIVKTYTASQTNNVIPSFEFFIGCQKPIAAHLVSPSFLGQLGLRIAEAGNANLKGNIWEDADPNFNNFNYQYKINHVDVSMKGRLIGDFGYVVKPYISGSIGVGFNRAYGFTVTPIISEAVAPPTFASNTTTTVSFTLGIGLQKTIYENLQVAIGYEFADWGRSSLSPAAEQTTSRGPTLNHLYAQTLQFSLFYV
jgi:opacity protein-like surface antigen